MEAMNFPSAVVICHSQAPNGEELITLELEFHRFILSQLNTHRLLSKNVQSSRAIPISKMIEQVLNDPAMPIHWGKNQRGMVAREECNEDVSLGEEGWLHIREEGWKEACRQVAEVASAYEKAGYSKEIVNRLLEPWMKTKGIFTGTRTAWEAFFKLRCHPDAQAEIRVLAERIRESIGHSVPNKLKYGQYHLPYIKSKDFPLAKYATLEERQLSMIKVSCSCTAQVSYRKLDDSLDKAIKVYDMLNLPVNGVYPDDPPHYSPTEHIAKVVTSTTTDRSSGNFHSREFWQYRKALEMGMEQEFIQ